jgi:hypothetical protein
MPVEQPTSNPQCKPGCPNSGGGLACRSCMKAEIERLTADRDSWKSRIMHLTEVEQDNDRLRAALERIEAGSAGGGDMENSARDIASEALMLNFCTPSAPR